MKVKARVTVRTHLDRFVGGAKEETIIARVGEGIVSTIGSSENYKVVLESPDSISKTVLARGLDVGSAFEQRRDPFGITPAHVGGPAADRAHSRAVCFERANEIAADETGCAGNDDAVCHEVVSIVASGLLASGRIEYSNDPEYS